MYIVYVWDQTRDLWLEYQYTNHWATNPRQKSVFPSPLTTIKWYNWTRVPYLADYPILVHPFQLHVITQTLEREKERQSNTTQHNTTQDPRQLFPKTCTCSRRLVVDVCAHTHTSWRLGCYTCHVRLLSWTLPPIQRPKRWWLPSIHVCMFICITCAMCSTVVKVCTCTTNCYGNLVGGSGSFWTIVVMDTPCDQMQPYGLYSVMW